MQETLSQNCFNRIKKLKRTSTPGIILLRLILLLSAVSISDNLDWFNHSRQGYREYTRYASISISLWRSAPSYWFTSVQGLPGNFRPQEFQGVSGWPLTVSLFKKHERENRCFKKCGIYYFPCESWLHFTRWEVARDCHCPCPLWWWWQLCSQHKTGPVSVLREQRGLPSADDCQG